MGRKRKENTARKWERLIKLLGKVSDDAWNLEVFEYSGFEEADLRKALSKVDRSIKRYLKARDEEAALILSPVAVEPAATEEE